MTGHVGQRLDGLTAYVLGISQQLIEIITDVIVEVLQPIATTKRRHL